MSNTLIANSWNFDVGDDAIHRFASAILLSDDESELTLSQGKYAYQVRGGADGYLYYKRGTGNNWIVIANWCFYGLYVVVRCRKPVWLRPMYQSLFAGMNFVSVAFHEYSIELVGKDGEILRSRRVRLSPPFAVEEVMMGKFHYSAHQVGELKLSLNL